MKKRLFVAVACALCLLVGWSGIALAWDKQERYRNYGPVPAYDLTKILWGNYNITNAIHSPFQNHVVLHFGPFTIIHWYNPTVPVPPGGYAWACFNRAGNQRIRILGAWWTDQNGNFIRRAGPNLSQSPRRNAGRVLFDLQNEATGWTGTAYPPEATDGPGAPIGTFTVTNAYYANTQGTVYTLDQLNESLYTDPSITWHALPSSFDLAYNQATTWDLGPDAAFAPGDNVLVRFTLSDGTELADDIAQFQNTDLVSVPGLPWWGAILLALILVTIGFAALRRGRRTDAAAA